MSNVKSNFKEVFDGKWKSIHLEHFLSKVIIIKITNSFLTEEEKKGWHIPPYFPTSSEISILALLYSV